MDWAGIWVRDLVRDLVPDAVMDWGWTVHRSCLGAH